MKNIVNLNKRVTKRSFTLIELLIVIIIIGVLTVVAIPRFAAYKINATGPEAMNMLNRIGDAAWMYYIEKGEFAGDLYGVPPEFGVGLPPGQKTKNFQFSYGAFQNNSMNLEAWYKYDFLEKLPDGAIFMFRLLYTNSPGSQGVKGSPLGNGWYKFYFHMVKNSSKPFLMEGRPGWPGSHPAPLDP